MRLLITGAAGFFGSRLAALATDDEVHAVDAPGVSTARLDALAPRAHRHTVDLLDRDAVTELVRRVRPEAAVHLAWFAVPGKYLDAPENLAHLEGALHLARTLAEAGTKRLCTAGTCFEYDTAAGLLSETSRTAPASLYAAAKVSMFEVLRQASTLWSISFAHLRFFYQYGPWEAPRRLVPAVLEPLLRGEEAAVSEGTQIRDFLHIEDVARAVSLVLRSDLEGPVNVASGVPVRVRDVVAEAARACGRPELVRYGAIAQRPGDPPFVCGDAARLRSIGFRPRFDLATGLADTVAWYRERGLE